MAEARIKLPDGRTAIVRADTREELMAKVERVTAGAAPAGPAPVNPLQQTARDTNPAMAALVGAGSAVNDVGENLSRLGARAGRAFGVLGDRDVELNDQRLSLDDDAFRALREEQPISTGGGRLAMQIGMTAPVPGGVAGGILTRIGTGALAGGTTAAITSGPDENPYRSFAIGALAGGMAPVAVSAISSAITRLSKKPMQVMVDGRFTDEALEFLEKAKISPDDLNRETVLELRKVGALTKEQAQRFNLFKEFDARLEPTQAQLTRTRTDFVAQQQAAKTSNIVSKALDDQELIIRENVDAMIDGFGGRAVDSIDASNALTGAVQARINAADDAVDAVYKAAREALSDGKVIRADRLASTLRAYASDDQSTQGMLSAVKGDLVRRGILTENGRLQGRVDAEVAERVRQHINALIAENPSARSRIGRELKAAFDEDVATAVGDDLFKPARAAKSKLERSLERARKTRRDNAPDTLLEKVIDGRANPDQLIPDIMATSKTRAEDVEQVMAFLKSGDAGDIQQGAEAIAELRSGVIRELLAKANAGSGVTEAGVPIFSGAKFGKALDAMGTRKLSAIFDDDQLILLGRLRRIGEIRTPLPGTALGTGPSGLAVDMLGDKATNLADRATFGFASAIRELTRARREVAAARAMLSPAQPTEQALRAAGRVRARPLPGSVGAVTADRLQPGTEE